MIVYGITAEQAVALLAEGVDRNNFFAQFGPKGLVALLAEGVDRNYNRFLSPVAEWSRPPRGGRG